MKQHKLIQLLWNFLINTLAMSHVFPSNLRCWILRKLGMNIKNVSIRSGCYFRSSDVKIGSGTWINNNCFFDNDYGSTIEIGENCGVWMFCFV